MTHNTNLNERETVANGAIENITGILEKYTDQINLLDVIDIVDNLRTLAEIIKTPVEATSYGNKKYVLQRKGNPYQSARRYGVEGQRKVNCC